MIYVRGCQPRVCLPPGVLWRILGSTHGWAGMGQREWGQRHPSAGYVGAAQAAGCGRGGKFARGSSCHFPLPCAAATLCPAVCCDPPPPLGSVSGGTLLCVWLPGGTMVKKDWKLLIYVFECVYMQRQLISMGVVPHTQTSQTGLSNFRSTEYSWSNQKKRITLPNSGLTVTRAGDLLSI